MENKHPSYFREGDGKCAILFIHGILGSPNHFNRFIPSVPKNFAANAARDCFGITPTRNLLRYVTWLPRYIELFSEMKRVRSSLSELKVPAIAFQSAHDELEARHASLSILMSHPAVKTYVMCGSGHFFIEKNDLDNVFRVFIKALRSMNEE